MTWAFVGSDVTRICGIRCWLLGVKYLRIEKKGVMRTAIDSGLLDKDDSKPVGILRLIIEGNPA
jgi:hypothetical protein